MLLLMHEETQKYTPLGKAGAYCLNERIYSEHFLSDQNNLENGSLLLSGGVKNLGIWLGKQSHG